MAKIATVRECVITDRSCQAGKGNRGQRNARAKHIVGQGIQCFGQNDGFQGSAAFKSGMTNGSCTVGQSKCSERSAECKCFFLDRGDVVAKIQLRQLVASDKASFADCTNTVVFNRYDMEIVAPCESVIANVLDCGGNQDGNDIMIVSERHICNHRYVTAHVLRGDNEMVVHAGTDAGKGTFMIVKGSKKETCGYCLLVHGNSSLSKDYGEKMFHRAYILYEVHEFVNTIGKNRCDSK